MKKFVVINEELEVVSETFRFLDEAISIATEKAEDNPEFTYYVLEFVGEAHKQKSVYKELK